MRRFLLFFLICFEVHGSTLDLVEHSISQVAKQSSHATVKISFLKENFSGALVSHKGHILTLKGQLNRNAKGIEVTASNGKTYSAKVIKTWPLDGFALLKIDAHGLSFLPLGYSENIQVADQIISLGNAFNAARGHSTRCGAHYGIISGLRKYESHSFYFRSRIFLTDARINTGAQGGPVIDLNGYLIGINGIPIISPETNSHVNVILPLETISQSLKQLIDFKEKQNRDALFTVDARHLLTRGLLVKTVTPAARQAGLNPDDVIIEVGDHEVNTPEDYYEQAFKFPAERLVPVTIYRNGNFLKRYLPSRQHSPVTAMLVSEAYRKAIKKISPSVVSIFVEREQVAGHYSDESHLPVSQRSFQLGQGPFTGIVYRRDGYILTSSFNLAGQVREIEVVLPDGRRFTAEQLGSDLGRNITLLKIPAYDLIEPKRARSNLIEVGSTVLSLGRTYAQDGLPTVDRGVVSALNRSAGKAIQIDANLTPGNFGGPTVTLDGQVIGINIPQASNDGLANQTAGGQFSGSGIGFVVPIWDIDFLFSTLKQGQNLEPAFLGIRFRNDISVDGAEISGVIKEIGIPKEGVTLYELQKASSNLKEFRQLHEISQTGAFKSGLQEGDIIKTFNGETIPSWNVLLNSIGRLNAGETVIFEIERFNKRLKVKATLGPRGRVMP